jgi:hypothetical protein
MRPLTENELLQGRRGRATRAGESAGEHQTADADIDDDQLNKEEYICGRRIDRTTRRPVRCSNRCQSRWRRRQRSVRGISDPGVIAT